MIVYRTYDEPKPFLDQSAGAVVWGIPCLTDTEVINIYFDSEDNAWNFFNEVNFRFFPLEVNDSDESETTQT